MAFLTHEKEVDMMLAFTCIKTELIDAYEKKSDYPNLSHGEAKEVDLYNQIQVYTRNWLQEYKGKAYHPRYGIDSFYIENVDPHLTDDVITKIIDYAKNIDLIVREVLESDVLKQTHKKWLDSFFEQAKDQDFIGVYKKEIIDEIQALYKDKEFFSALQELVTPDNDELELTPLEETYKFFADNAVNQGLYSMDLPEGDIDLKEYRLFQAMDTYSWHNGLPKPILQAIGKGILHVLNGEIKVGICDYEKCGKLVRQSSRGGQIRRFCSPLHRNYQFRESKKALNLQASNA